jgi:hypothetical protein
MEESVDKIMAMLRSLQLELIQKQSELEKEREEFRRKVEPLEKEVKNLTARVESYRRQHIPNLTIAEVNDKTSGKRYVRASIRYYVEGSDKHKTTSVHLGKLSDYSGGLEDSNLIGLAHRKAMELIIKKKGEAQSADLK